MPSLELITRQGVLAGQLGLPIRMGLRFRPGWALLSISGERLVSPRHICGGYLFVDSHDLAEIDAQRRYGITDRGGDRTAIDVPQG